MSRRISLLLVSLVFVLIGAPIASAAPATPTPTASAKRKVPVDQNIDLTSRLRPLYYYLTEDRYGIKIRGEVKNTSRHPIDGPTIFFTLYDKDGNVLGGDRASTAFLVIAPRNHAVRHNRARRQVLGC